MKDKDTYLKKLEPMNSLSEAMEKLANEVAYNRQKMYYSFVSKELTKFIMDYYKNNKNKLSELDLEIEILTHLPLITDKFTYMVEEANKKNLFDAIDKIRKEHKDSKK